MESCFVETVTEGKETQHIEMEANMSVFMISKKDLLDVLG